MLIVDSPRAWAATQGNRGRHGSGGLAALGLTGVGARNAALYFSAASPASDPALDGQLDTFVPCGIIAGVMARTDTQRGVWKAPAGLRRASMAPRLCRPI
jgi:phage tail sheath protein FI